MGRAETFRRCSFVRRIAIAMGAEALESASGVLQAALNRELKLRRTPRLAFVYDRAVEHGVRMTQLIDELTPADGGDDGDE